MWHIKNPEIKKASLDFTSSGQNKPEVLQLVYEDAILINAIEYVDFDRSEAVQLIVCDHCGYTNCSSGNWVCFRRSDERILLIPCFEQIEIDSWHATEYAPPAFYNKATHEQKIGTPFFDLETYEKLRESILHLPAFAEVANLKMSEAVRLAQFNMPFQFFGESPRIFIQPDKRDLVVGASEGEHGDHLQRIEEILKSNYDNDSPALIRRLLPDEEFIYLFLDADEFTDWQALVKSGTNYYLPLEEGFVIESP